MDATITIRDFSGGLNTATEESRIPANSTSDMVNVSITDSRGFARRKGYTSLTLPQLSATARVSQPSGSTKLGISGPMTGVYGTESDVVSQVGGTEVTPAAFSGLMRIFQTFTLDGTVRVRGASMRGRNTAGTSTASYHIYNVSGGLPSSLVASSSNVSFTSTIGTVRGSLDVILPPGQYAIAVESDSNVSTWSFVRSTDGSSYARGSGGRRDGTGWVLGDGADSTIDWFFVIHAQPVERLKRARQTVTAPNTIRAIKSFTCKLDIVTPQDVLLSVLDAGGNVVGSATAAVTTVDGDVTFTPSALSTPIGAGEQFAFDLAYVGFSGESLLYTNPSGGYAGGSLSYSDSSGQLVNSTSDMVFDVLYEYQVAGETKTIYRHHAGSARYWVSLFGTTVSVAQDGSQTDSYGLVQVESLSATSSVFPAPNLSGGSAVNITAAGSVYSVPVPYSSYIKASWNGDGLERRLDGGSWIAATGTSIELSGLTATTHTLDFRAAGARNTASLKLAPAGDLKYRERRKAIYPSTNGTYEVSFYDDGSSTNRDILVKVYIGGVIYQVGVYKDKSTAFYCYLEGGELNNTQITQVKRSQGWHTWRFTIGKTSGRLSMSTGSLDRTLINSANNRFQSIPATYFTIGLYCRSRTSGTVTAYFDEVRQNHKLIEDFTAITGWTAHGDATDTDAASSEQYTVGERCLIDTIEYKASAGWTRIAGVSATADRLACTTMNGRLYFGTRYNALRSWNGATVATITASGVAPAAEFLQQKQSRIFAAGKNADRSILEYTAVGSGNNWTDGGALRPSGVGSGQNCTGMAKWNDALFYFTENSTRVLAIQGDELSWVNREQSDKVGCLAPDSIATAPNAIVFLSNTGIRAYGLISGVNDSDGSGFLLLSENITPTLERINQAAVHKACAAFYDNKYFLSLPLDGSMTNNYTLVYRFPEAGQRGAWMLYDYGFRSMYVSRGDEEGLYGGGYDGIIYRLEYGDSDAGKPIVMRYRIPPATDKTGYAIAKTWRRIHVTAESGALQTLTITPYTDFVNGQPVVVEVTDATDTRPIRQPLSARGRSIGAEITSSGSAQNLTVSEVTFTYIPGRMR